MNIGWLYEKPFRKSNTGFSFTFFICWLYPANTTGYKSQTASAQEELRIAAATSACDTGLLDALNKKFEETNNVKIITTCRGTGKAIAAGELGEADVVMAQSVPDELQAVANGSFVNRRYMMYNYFVIVGPENDPAEIKNASNAPDAFRRIAARQSTFISRGDDSVVS